MLRINCTIRTVIALLLGMSAMAVAQDAPATQPAGVSGTWTWTSNQFGGQNATTLILKQEGDKVTGTITGFQGQEDPIAEGAVKDGVVTFKVTRDFGGGGNPLTTNYTLKFEDGSLKGASELIIKQEIDAKRSN